jgi:hypothetical protein
MSASLLRTASVVAAVALFVSASTAPVSAGGCMRPQGCLPASNTAWSDWPDLFGDLHGGVLTKAVLGSSPYNRHGYNSSACIGYQDICDQSGNVIGRRPIVIC